MIHEELRQQDTTKPTELPRCGDRNRTWHEVTELKDKKERLEQSELLSEALSCLFISPFTSTSLPLSVLPHSAPVFTEQKWSSVCGSMTTPSFPHEHVTRHSFLYESFTLFSAVRFYLFFCFHIYILTSLRRQSLSASFFSLLLSSCPILLSIYTLLSACV